MTHHPLGETREQRKELTKQALAGVVWTRMAASRLRQTNVARWSGISRSCLRSLLDAEKGCSLFVFLELSRGLRVDDACELLRDVLARRDEIRGRSRQEAQ